MNQNPDISIITINYNGFQDTCELIDSLYRHIHSCCYEIIVIDNGSNTNEAKLLFERYPNIITSRSEKNLGFAGGNNLGIKLAKGKYFFLLNNDVYVEDDHFDSLYSTMEKNPQIGAISPKIKFAAQPQHIQFAGYTPMSTITLRNRGIGYDEPDIGQYDTSQVTYSLHGAAMLFRPEIIQKVGLMPEIYFLYYEETDWCCKMLRAGYQLWYEPQCTIFHKESRSTGTNSPLKTYYLTRNRLLYAWRNRCGIKRLFAILYQLGIANIKKLIVFLLKREFSHLQATLKGCKDFFLLQNKLDK